MTERSAWVCIEPHGIADKVVLDPNYIGRGLATELVLRVAEHRDLPISTNFTMSGRRLLERT